MLDGGRDVEAAVGVEAEAVATAVAELLDHPLARAVGEAAAAGRVARPRRACRRVERDAVAVEKPSANGRHGAVARVHQDAAGGLFLRREVAGVGEVHAAVGRDREIVGAVEAVVGRYVTAPSGAASCRPGVDGHARRERRRRRRALATSKPPFCVTRIEPSAASAAPFAPPWSRRTASAAGLGPHAEQRAARRRS